MQVSTHEYKGELSNQKKVLIVDDDVFLANSLQRLLHARHYQCIAVTNAQNALYTILEEKPDLILLDLYMPEISGLHLLNQLKHHSMLKKIPVVILTSFSNEELARATMAMGASAYLVKKHILKDLLPILSEYCTH